MPRRSYKRNKKGKSLGESAADVPVEIDKTDNLPEIEVLPIPSPSSYKDVLNKEQPINLIPATVVKLSEKGVYINTYPIAEMDIIHWGNCWNRYLSELFSKFVLDEYQTPECYDEFVEVAYLTTPFSFRSNRIARPNDTFVLPLTQTNLDIPLHHLRHQAKMDGYPVFQANENPIIINTPFSMYLYGIEGEYVPKIVDDETISNEIEVEEDVYFEPKVVVPTPTPITIEELMIIYDSSD